MVRSEAQATFTHTSWSAHTEHVLLYVVAGELTVEQPRRSCARPGTLVALPAGVPHRFQAPAPVSFHAVAFCTGCLDLAEHHDLMRPFRRARSGQLACIPIPTTRQEAILGHFGDLARFVPRADAVGATLARSALVLLLGDAYDAADAVPSAAGPPLVSDALAYIDEHATRSVSLRDVARAVGRSPGHVATCVKEATGYTVGDWITARRLTEAAALLLHTDDGVEAIAGRVGWADRTHFTRLFRRRYGTSPGAWRRAQRP